MSSTFPIATAGSIDLVQLAAALAALGSPPPPPPPPPPAAGPPTNVKAIAQPYTALVAFTEPAAPAGKTIAGYQLKCPSAGWLHGAALHSPILAQGGNPGWTAPAAFLVVAVYTDGTTSADSVLSNPVATLASGPATSGDVYVNGVFDWVGDYTYGTSVFGTDYDADGGKRLAIHSLSNAGWQPYAPFNSFDLTPYTAAHITVSGDPGEDWVFFAEKAGDITVGINAVNLSKYGAGPSYVVPLRDLNLGAGTPNPVIYKFQLHTTLAAPHVFYIVELRLA